MATPSWLAATAGQPPKANQVNQFIGTHASTFIYAGNQQNADLSTGAGSVPSNGQYNAQKFTTPAAYTTGRMALNAAVTGTPPPITYTIQSDAAGAPSGVVLASVTIPSQWYSGTLTGSSIPIPGGVLANATQYWIVTSAVGDASNFFSFGKSVAASGSSTSPNGTAWTTQAYGLFYFVGDLTVTGPLAHLWEDGGLRWNTFGRNSNTQVTTLKEYTVGQTNTGYLQSTRTLTYNGAGDLTGVT